MPYGWRDNMTEAMLSLLLPGWGQFAQRRAVIAGVQMTWAIVALVALLLGPVLPWPRALAWGDLVLVTCWSVLDALLWRGSTAA